MRNWNWTLLMYGFWGMVMGIFIGYTIWGMS